MGMFDDLIPQQAAPAPVAPPPGMFDDLIPTAGAGSTELVSTTPAQGDHPARVTIGTNPQAPPSAMHGFRVGAQGVAKGLLHTAAMPFDLMAGAQNLVTGGINKVFGTEIPQATPASQLAEQAAAPITVPQSEMSPQERLVENISDFGTQGLVGGSTLMLRAPTTAANIAGGTVAPTKLGRVADAFARPYTETPGRAIAGDIAGGVGAGAAVNTAQEHNYDGPLASFLAPLAGGVGGATAMGLSTGAVKGIGNMIQRLFAAPPKDIPLNPRTGAQFSPGEVDAAARKMQAPLDTSRETPVWAAHDIRTNAADLGVDRPEMPTSGMLSRNSALVGAEQRARLDPKQSTRFIERDQNIKEAGANQIASVRDPNADQGAVPRAAEVERTNRMAPAEANLQQRTDQLTSQEQARQQQGAEFGAVANTNAQATASRNLDRAVVDQNYIPARAEKNRQFDEAPGRTEELPADNVFAAVDRVMARNNQLRPDQQIPGDLIHRLEALRPQMEMQESRVLDPSGQPVQREVNVGGPGTAQGGDLADLRKHISAAREAAQRAGNFDMADSLGALGQAVNRTIETAPGYAEANANYHQFADRFRPERNDEGAKFTKEIDRGGQQPDGTLNRGSTPPTATADRFLKSPEKAQALNRMLAGAPSEQAGQAAIRDYMRSDFAMSVMNPDGSINPARAAAWGRNNADVLAQFPALRQEFDGVQQAAQRGQQASTEARTFLDQARRTRDTEAAAFERSAAGTLLRDDPRDVAASILNSRWSAERRLDEINNLVRNDEVAKRGWKAAFADELNRRVTGTKEVDGNYEARYAQLAKEFKNNEHLLAKVFDDPEQMNTLRQAHKLLGYFKEAEKRAVVGSQTAERLKVPDSGELALRHIYGDLKGGGMIRRFNLLLEQLPNNKASVDELMNMAWFNPDVAAFLLERPVTTIKGKDSNVYLRRAIAAANAARGENGNGDKH